MESTTHALLKAVAVTEAPLFPRCSGHRSIAPGTVLIPKAVVNTGTVVEKGCIINIGALIDHDCTIEEGVHICLGAIVKGENRIKRLSKIEAGEIVERAQYTL